MVPRREILTSDRWFEVLSHWQAERAMIREHLDVLKTTIGRLHALRPAYLELLGLAQVIIQNVSALQRDLNTFAGSLGMSPIPSAVVLLPDDATVIQLQVQANVYENLEVDAS